jgi:hypothetical protein
MTMKVSIILFTLILTLNLSAQFKISGVYIGGGYLDSKLHNLNASLFSYPDNSVIQFKEVKGFNNIEIGLITTFKRFDNFSIDFRANYLLPLSQKLEIQTFKSFSGLTYEEIISAEPLTFEDTVIYPYAYKLQTYTLSILPSYKVMNYKWFSSELGIGLIFYHTFLSQEGVKVNASPTLLTTDAISMSINDMTISWLGNVKLCFQISSHLFIDTQMTYQTGRIKNMANDYPYWYDSVNPDCNEGMYPITHVDIDFTGLNYTLKLRYKI